MCAEYQKFQNNYLCEGEGEEFVGSRKDCERGMPACETLSLYFCSIKPDHFYFFPFLDSVVIFMSIKPDHFYLSPFLDR